jgi:hypothetical protein
MSAHSTPIIVLILLLAALLAASPTAGATPDAVPGDAFRDFVEQVGPTRGETGEAPLRAPVSGLDITAVEAPPPGGHEPDPESGRPAGRAYATPLAPRGTADDRLDGAARVTVALRHLHCVYRL